MRFSSHEIYEHKNKFILAVKNNLNNELESNDFSTFSLSTLFIQKLKNNINKYLYQKIHGVIHSIHSILCVCEQCCSILPPNTF